ncbi:MAG: isoprenylcysteine carboxylmethyltransferase family protein [Candidatus Bathyarchaeota archaeon]|uniref:methyltransferase family protein n=1 Tax=Candidatus Bathycorpusculum sp. TaxID=2994959 RepID=UPI0028241F2A|nr:isoprenylcysteine carboxylmethyltransferase family protein [Candidatus Termiticorpusculum sp.]MCL2292397.1 isoprenylcysteine carboxylmethyltransferase family protein [Candidatus Termiticorpusculum sp.]
MDIIKIFAIVLLSAFYIIYFIKMLLLKRQNITGNILGKGQKPKEKAHFETILRTVTILGVPIKFVSVIWDKLLWSLPTLPTIRENGLILMLFGVVVFLLAVTAMKNNWRAGYNYEQNTQLVTNGIYKFSRNPAFVGFDLIYIGCALAFPNILNITLTLLVVTLFHIQILGEEEFLSKKFGQQYLEYKIKVNRYITIPGLKRDHENKV